jgi:acetyltransferase-like isoleucine patch superfamily enzyme
VAACAVVSKDVDPWTVVAGNPAIVKKQRRVKPSGS